MYRKHSHCVPMCNAINHSHIKNLEPINHLRCPNLGVQVTIQYMKRIETPRINEHMNRQAVIFTKRQSPVEISRGSDEGDIVEDIAGQHEHGPVPQHGDQRREHCTGEGPIT